MIGAAIRFTFCGIAEQSCRGGNLDAVKIHANLPRHESNAFVGEPQTERGSFVSFRCVAQATRQRRGQDKANSADFACAMKALLSLDYQKLKGGGKPPCCSEQERKSVFAQSQTALGEGQDIRSAACRACEDRQGRWSGPFRSGWNPSAVR